MPLSRELDGLTLSVPCSHCGHVLRKKGSSVRSVSHYTCKSCKQQFRVTYSDKLKLFADHTRKNLSA
jgi:transposase-like protein